MTNTGKQPTIKLAAIDLDGTLLRSDQTLSAREVINEYTEDELRAKPL